MLLKLSPGSALLAQRVAALAVLVAALSQPGRRPALVGPLCDALRALETRQAGAGRRLAVEVCMTTLPVKLHDEILGAVGIGAWHYAMPEGIVIDGPGGGAAQEGVA